MAFNQQRVKAAFTGAGVAYTAPFAAFKGSQIALNTLVAGTITSTAGLVIACAGPTWNIEWDSLFAFVETDITTNTIVVASGWQGSWDGTNWMNINGPGATTPFLQTAAAGTGGLVTTQYVHPFYMNPAHDYLRLAVKNTVATGAAGDNVTVSYGFRKRSFLS
jgi:hypothetical protein